MNRVPWALLPLVGCANLDAFVFNPIHCSTVSEETCTAYDNDWDNACVPCEEPYDWAKPYPWFDTMLEPGQGVRAVADELVTRLTLQTEDSAGELDAYFVAAHGEDAELSEVTVVYNHGNYLGIEHYLPRVRVLHEAGYNVLIWDYRGYGKSLPDTVPTPEQHLSDARIVLDAARTFAPDPDRLVSYGYSVGGITATEMGTDEGVCAVVLEAPFTSIAAISRSNTKLSLGEGFLTTGQWDNFDRMARTPHPVLGLVGELDERFPPDDVAALLDAAAGPTDLWVLEGVRHGVSNGGVVEAGMTPYLDRVRGFLGDHGCL